MRTLDLPERDLDHAMWRVNFLTSMLQSHRALPNRDASWQEKAVEYQERMKAAWLELESLRGLPEPAQEMDERRTLGQ